MKNLHAANGHIYAQIGDDGVLRKSEKQCDRLRITGCREHALDETLLQEALSLGVTRLEIKERGDDGVIRLWIIKLDDLLRFGKIKMLRGIKRRTIPLVRCTLASGTPEGWYSAEQAAMRKEEKPIEPPLEQGLLFAATDY